MAKYWGAIGFVVTEETAPDVWEERIVERNYSGDVLRDRYQWQGAQQVNDNFNVSNRISIVADRFAVSHLHAIRYLTWLGTKWKVKSAEVLRPRLLLEIGDVYNEEEEP